MATIKINAQNKIITKSGKVSCGCCGGGECCMYSASNLNEDGIEGYTVDDLPDVLNYYGSLAALVILNKLNPPEPSNLIDGLAYYRGQQIYEGEEGVVELGIFQGDWMAESSIANQPRSPGGCLIVNGLTEDQFAETYIATFKGFPGVDYSEVPENQIPTVTDTLIRTNSNAIPVVAPGLSGFTSDKNKWVGQYVTLQWVCAFPITGAYIYGWAVISKTNTSRGKFYRKIDGEHNNTPAGTYSDENPGGLYILTIS